MASFRVVRYAFRSRRMLSSALQICEHPNRLLPLSLLPVPLCDISFPAFLHFGRPVVQSLSASTLSYISSGRNQCVAKRSNLHTTEHNSVFRISEEKSEDKLKKAEAAVDKEHKEEKPEGLFAKFKYYFKRYWYIAIPLHIANCTLWFIVLYVAVKSGLDVVALLEQCRVPIYVIEKVKSVPPNAGVVVVALLLYKIATPLRYAATLILIQVSFPVLRRFGILTAKEVKYKVRLKYTNKVRGIKRRYQQKYHRPSPSSENKRRQSNGDIKRY